MKKKKIFFNIPSCLTWILPTTEEGHLLLSCPWNKLGWTMAFRGDPQRFPCWRCGASSLLWAWSHQGRRIFFDSLDPKFWSAQIMWKPRVLGSSGSMSHAGTWELGVYPEPHHHLASVLARPGPTCSPWGSYITFSTGSVSPWANTTTCFQRFEQHTETGIW